MSAWYPGDCSFIPGQVALKTLKVVVAAFRQRSAQPEVRRVKCMCVVRLSCISFNSVQSFMIAICKGPPIYREWATQCVLNTRCPVPLPL